MQGASPGDLKMSDIYPEMLQYNREDRLRLFNAEKEKKKQIKKQIEKTFKRALVSTNYQCLKSNFHPGLTFILLSLSLYKSDLYIMKITNTDNHSSYKIRTIVNF